MFSGKQLRVRRKTSSRLQTQRQPRKAQIEGVVNNSTIEAHQEVITQQNEQRPVTRSLGRKRISVEVSSAVSIVAESNNVKKLKLSSTADNTKAISNSRDRDVNSRKKSSRSCVVLSADRVCRRVTKSDDKTRRQPASRRKSCLPCVSGINKEIQYLSTPNTSRNSPSNDNFDTTEKTKRSRMTVEHIESMTPSKGIKIATRKTNKSSTLTISLTKKLLANCNLSTEGAMPVGRNERAPNSTASSSSSAMSKNQIYSKS